MKDKRFLYAVLLAVTALILVGALVIGNFWGNRRFVNEPLHSTIEALGAFAAIAMAAILLQGRQTNFGGKYFLLAMGFLGMGLLDGFHAVSFLGRGFVFLHSFASLVGGLFFALVWLPRPAIEALVARRKTLLRAVVAITLALLAAGIAGDFLPMVRNGVFTPDAVVVNLAAGFLFICASVRLLLDFHRSIQPELYLLAAVALLFGLAELTFTYSALWTGVWWFWHVIRLMAYVLVLGFIFRAFRQTVTDLEAALARSGQAETELSRRFQGLVETTMDWVWEVDENAVYTYASPQVRDLLGYEPEEIIGKTPFDLMPPAEAERVAAVFQPIAQAQQPFKLLENINLHKEGREVVLETSGVPIFDQAGDFRGYRGIDRDITERSRAKDLSDALNDINVLINSTLDVGKIMQSVIVEATQVIGCEAAALVLRQQERWVFAYPYGLPDIEPGTTVEDEEAQCALSAVATKTVFLSNDALKDARIDPTLVQRCGFRSVLCMPLIIKNKVLGVLDFYYVSAPAAFSELQIDFANKLAAGVALALENAELYAEEHNIAFTLQEALLKMPAKVAGIDFGYAYRSATEEAGLVGGDFYDLFELEHGRVGMVIGDVSGKGIEAAAMTSLVKNTIRAYAYQETSPARVMANTNKLVKKAGAEGFFVTVIFAVLEPATGRLISCGAGHPPPVVKKAGGASFLNVRCPAIGVLPTFDYHDTEEKIDPGDVLIFYSDGVIEARKGKDFFGEGRLIDAVNQLEPTIRIKDIPEALLNEVSRFTGGGFRDDIALLVVGPTAIEL